MELNLSLSRILIVKLSALGDIVHALPAVSRLIRAFPDAQIDWLVEEKNRAIIDMSRMDIGVIPIDTKALRKKFRFNGLAKIVQTVKNIQAVRYDCVIDFQGLIKSALLTFLSGAPLRIGFSYTSVKEPIASFFYTKRVPATRVHIVEQLYELLSPLDVAPTDARTPLLFAPDHNQIVIRDKLHRLSRYVLIHPGGSWATKRWHRFSELAVALAKGGLPVVITCAPNEKELLFDANLSPESGVYQFTTTLEEFVALCEGASLFVGGDSGPLHIATSMGIPIVALFGPTSSARNGPLNKEDIVVERTLPCRPCMKRDHCPLGHWHCMEEISVEEVYKACLHRIWLGVR